MMRRALIMGIEGVARSYLNGCPNKPNQHETTVRKTSSKVLESTQASTDTLDIGNHGETADMLKAVDSDVLFHPIEISSVAYSWNNLQFVISISSKDMLNLLDVVRERTSSPRIFLIWSGEVFGQVNVDDDPIVEETYLRPGNTYAAKKVSQGMLDFINANANVMSVVNTRTLDHARPGQADAFVLSVSHKQVACIEVERQKPVIHVRNLLARRDFADVRDVVKVYMGLVKSGELGQVYNVENRLVISLKVILEMVLVKIQSAVKAEVDESWFRPIDIPFIEADVTRLRECAGWKSQYSLEERIQETIDLPPFQVVRRGCL